MELEEMWTERHPRKKSQDDVKEDMKRFYLLWEDVQDWNKWRMKMKGQWMRSSLAKTKVLDFGLSPAQKFWSQTEFSLNLVLGQSLRLWSQTRVVPNWILQGYYSLPRSRQRQRTAKTVMFWSCYLFLSFWATVCKTVRPMLLVRCLSVLSCPVLSVLSVTFVLRGQMVGRIKTKLGMQVGFGPGHLSLIHI